VNHGILTIERQTGTLSTKYPNLDDDNGKLVAKQGRKATGLTVRWLGYRNN